MLGFRSSRKDEDENRDDGNRDVARLFFDSFSKRLGSVEEALRTIQSEFDKVNGSIEQGRISDLVLLDRIQKAEELVRVSLSSITTAIEKAYSIEEVRAVSPSTAVPRGQHVVQTTDNNGPIIASHVLSPTGEMGSLPSITTPTELQVLTLLASEGSKSAPEIGRAVGRSREHTARLMKKLFEEGYIRRDQSRIPFRYSVVNRLRTSVKKAEAKDEERESISVPQS